MAGRAAVLASPRRRNLHSFFCADRIVPRIAAGDEDTRRLPVYSSHRRHGGASERCFCAYAEAGDDLDALDAECPSWRAYVSTDGTRPTKLGYADSVTTVGRPGRDPRLVYSRDRERRPCATRTCVLGAGNSTLRRYGSLADWAVDLGSGQRLPTGAIWNSRSSLRVVGDWSRARKFESVLKSHGSCESVELSKVQIGLETTEFRVESETQIAACRAGAGSGYGNGTCADAGGQCR